MACGSFCCLVASFSFSVSLRQYKDQGEGSVVNGRSTVTCQFTHLAYARVISVGN